MRYLTASELIYINGTLLRDPQILSGQKQIRMFELLDAAVARPAQSAFGQDAYPTLREKVAALMHSLVRNHAFVDGNKRTATVAAIFMFRVNGQRVVWQPQEALSMILSVAERRCELAALAEWFPLVATGECWEADAPRDMAVIDAIIEEHRWLLNELEKR